MRPDGQAADVVSVNLRMAICAVIPSFVERLKDGDEDVQSAAVSGVVKLAEYGEFD